ncbi:hypothetical protein [Fluviicola taffensis]|uniref:hypothetical protein n=1 Tax=Fluviicola taffensis TaxID=191579 RepID=UPI0031378FCB
MSTRTERVHCGTLIRFSLMTTYTFEQIDTAFPKTQKVSEKWGIPLFYYLSHVL